MNSLDGTLANLSASGGLYLTLVTGQLAVDGQSATWDTVVLSEDRAIDSVLPLEEGRVYAGRTPRDGRVVDFTHLLARLDADGHEVWTLPYFEQGMDVRTSRILDMGGGFLVAGTYKLPSNDASDEKYHAYAVRVDGDGNMVWQNSYVGESDSLTCRAAAATADGGVLLAVQPNVRRFPGWERTQAQVIRLDTDGNVVWHRSLGGASIPRAVLEAANGDVLLANAIEVDDLGATSDRIQLVRADADGNGIWSRIIGGNGLDHLTTLLETSDGGILIVAQSFSFTDTEYGDTYVVKLDANGQGLELPSDL